MSDQSPLDRRLRDWMAADAPERASDHLRDSVRTSVDATAQELARYPWVLRLRGPIAHVASAVAGGIAVLLIVATVGVNLSSPPGGIPSPSASQSPGSVLNSSGGPSPTPSVSASPTLLGPHLPAGRFTTTRFSPTAQLIVPDGWVLVEDEFATLYLSPIDADWAVQGDGSVRFDGIALYRRPVAGPPDGASTPVSGVGTSAKDLSTWMSRLPQLSASTPKRLLLGGLAGYQLDFQLSGKAGFLCQIACVNLLNSGDGVDHYAYGIEGPERVRSTFVDVPGGPTVMIAIDAPSGSGFDALAAAAEPILHSLAFPSP